MNNTASRIVAGRRNPMTPEFIVRILSIDQVKHFQHFTAGHHAI